MRHNIPAMQRQNKTFIKKSATPHIMWNAYRVSCDMLCSHKGMGFGGFVTA